MQEKAVSTDWNIFTSVASRNSSYFSLSLAVKVPLKEEIVGDDLARIDLHVLILIKTNQGLVLADGRVEEQLVTLLERFQLIRGGQLGTQ